MTVEIRLWGEYTWTTYHDWKNCLYNLRDQIRNALDDAGMSHDVQVVTSDKPDAPDPFNLYNSDNSEFWDSYLDQHSAYAEDSSVLVMEDKGGATFSSGLNGGTTTDGCMTLVGGQDLDGSETVVSSGTNEHFHDVYNELHELSHALDAPTGTDPIGKYFQDYYGYYHRSPCQTKYDVTNECGHYNPSNSGTDNWDLTYKCGANYLTDQSV